MTDKEWFKNIKKHTNEELIDTLKYCGCDMYHYVIWNSTVKEIERRLKKQNDRTNI